MDLERCCDGTERLPYPFTFVVTLPSSGPRNKPKTVTPDPTSLPLYLRRDPSVVRAEEQTEDCYTGSIPDQRTNGGGSTTATLTDRECVGAHECSLQACGTETVTRDSTLGGLPERRKGGNPDIVSLYTSNTLL